MTDISVTAEATDLMRLKKEIEAERDAARDFISSVSHELRTPVAVLRGSLEALCDGVISEPDQVEEYHRQMLSESIYLQRLVNDLLEYSRLQNKDFEIIREYVNVCDVTADVCRSLRRIAKDKNIEFEYESEESFYMIIGDYARLRQMFIVVLDNAVKFTAPGGKVKIKNTLENGIMSVEISDTGCGIDHEELGKIFTKFHRVVSDQNRNGSGLGLAIAKEIALRHGAEIEVESEPGVGTTFRFVFGEQEEMPEE